MLALDDDIKEINSHAAGAVLYRNKTPKKGKIEEPGRIEILVFGYEQFGQDVSQEVIKLPFGTQESGETVMETLRRELYAELAHKNCKPEKFSINLLSSEPIYYDVKKADSGDVDDWHGKLFYLGEIRGYLRRQNRRDGLALLGRPQWIEASRLLNRHDDWYVSTRAHQYAIVAALSILAKESPNVARCYQNVLSSRRYIDLESEMEKSGNKEAVEKYLAQMG